MKDEEKNVDGVDSVTETRTTTTTSSNFAGKTKKIVKRISSSRPAQLAAAAAIIIVALNTFVSSLDKTLGAASSLDQVTRSALMRCSLLYGALLGKPVELADALKAYPEEFRNGAHFSRPIRISSDLNIGMNRFILDGPELIVENNSRIHRTFTFDNSHGVTQRPKLQRSNHLQGQDILQPNQTTGLSGRNGEDSALISITIGKLSGDLVIDNNGQNGQDGGPPADTWGVLPGVYMLLFSHWIPENTKEPDVVFLPKGLPGRGGDGGDGGNVTLRIKEVSEKASFTIYARGGMGGSSNVFFPGNTNFYGGDGKDGSISFGGANEEINESGALKCSFKPVDNRAIDMAKHSRDMEKSNAIEPPDIYDSSKMVGICFSYENPVSPGAL